MRPAGVLMHGQSMSASDLCPNTHVSKKLIGDLNMANAILSWSFLDAYRSKWLALSRCRMQVYGTHLNRTKDPKNQSLDDDQTGSTDAEGEVHPDILPDIRIPTFLAVRLGPLLKPNTTP